MTIAKPLFIVLSSSIANSKSAEAAAVWSDKAFDKLKPSWLPGTDPVPIIDCEKKSMENIEPEIVIFSTLYAFKIG